MMTTRSKRPLVFDKVVHCSLFIVHWSLAFAHRSSVFGHSPEDLLSLVGDKPPPEKPGTLHGRAQPDRTAKGQSPTALPKGKARPHCQRAKPRKCSQSCRRQCFSPRRGRKNIAQGKAVRPPPWVTVPKPHRSVRSTRQEEVGGKPPSRELKSAN